VTLCDTGPIVALIDRRDPYHLLCVKALEALPPEPFTTTWACLAESMYLLGRVGGLAAQIELWGFVSDGLIRLHETNHPELTRMRELMVQYGDIPMDLADASLVSAAESLGTRRILTLDRHFRAYRVEGRHSFEILV
jgi:predicted nucleic acid-binding protein